MVFLACLIFLAGLPPVYADGWDDFSNNLATDLAPFLSLFGEQLTKQYLSESITYCDYFIFAMAPMGILTAIVSAIRVCGSSNLRALIGRAQEGGGVAEAELCSSTSRDVCELYNNGGIARVFGRPKILEIVHDPNPHPKDEDMNVGIYPFQDYLKTENGMREWSEETESQDIESATSTFAPNLSLNIGIKSPPDYIIWAVTVLGFILQAGVLVFAAVVTYYLRWEKDGGHVDLYACPLAIVGTVLVCSGVYLCAFLVGQSTTERVFQRKKNLQIQNPLVPSTIYWIQPGDQSLGDQIFESFSWSDREKRLQKYISSRKRENNFEDNFGNIPENAAHNLPEVVIVWVAVGTTIFGFVLQFVGLRGLHSAISVAQLGAIMLMSTARAALRMERLKPSDNFLAECRDVVVGHELDWLALHIGSDDFKRDNSQSPCRTVTPTFGTPSSSSAAQYHSFWKFSGLTEQSSKIVRKLPTDIVKPNNATKLLAYRARLAQLTESPQSHIRSTDPSCFKVEMVEVRRVAQQLATAIVSVVNLIFSKRINIKLKEQWKSAESIYWGSDCNVTCNFKGRTALENQAQIFIWLQRKLESGTVPESPWKLENPAELEGLLGLWVWSLKFEQAIKNQRERGNFQESRATDFLTRRIVGIDKNIENLKMWHEGNNFDLQKHMLDIKSSGPSRPGKLRSLGECDIERNLDNSQIRESKQCRVFGWYAIEEFLRHDPNELMVWSTDEKASLMSLCSQEVFGSFLASILHVADNIGDIELKTEGNRFWLNNSLASEIVDLLVDHGLGSRDDALLCVVPIIMPACQQGKSFAAIALKAAKRSATQCRKDGEWKQAEKLLQWALNTCTKIDQTTPVAAARTPENYSDLAEEQGEKAAIALCELYRWALRDLNQKQFGIKGHTILNQNSDQLFKVKKVIDRYHSIIKEPNSDEYSDLDIRVSIGQRDLTAILHVLTWSRSIPKDIKGDLLHLSVKEGWTEIIAALQELGVDLDYEDQQRRTPMSYAAEYGSVECVKELIDFGSFPNSKDRELKTPLWHAAENGREAVIEVLIGDQRVELNAKDGDGVTPLRRAVQKGHEAVVKLFLDTGRVDSIVDDDGHGMLLQYAALFENNEEIVKLLLARDFDVNERAGHYGSALQAASYNGNEQIVRLLLENGADINAQGGVYGNALQAALRNNKEQTIKLLLDSGANVNAQGGEYGNALQTAVFFCREEIVKLLLANSADVNAQDRYGSNALCLATDLGKEQIVKLLLDNGANVNAQDEYHGNALQTALVVGRKQIAKLLLENGADVNAQGGKYGNALQAASQNGDEQIVKLLLENGADVNAQGGFYGNALQAASYKCQEQIIKLLLDNGADVNAQGGEYGNALQAASYRCQEQIIKLLLDNGADVNAQGGLCGNALQAASASKNSNEKIVKLFLDNGADVNGQGGVHGSALKAAHKFGNKNIVKLLLDNGAKQD